MSIKIEHLNYVYSAGTAYEKQALKDVCLEIPHGEFVGIIGPNASGKSNVMKAINFCCRMILDSHLYNEGTVFNFEPFKFDGWQDKSSKFLIDFVCDNIEYEYSFELTKEGILSESLYHYPVGRRAKVFVREANGKYSFGTGVIAKPLDVVLNTSEKNLFLSRASSMNREVRYILIRNSPLYCTKANCVSTI